MSALGHKRTSVGAFGMSAKGQKQTLARRPGQVGFAPSNGYQIRWMSRAEKLLIPAVLAILKGLRSKKEHS